MADGLAAAKISADLPVFDQIDARIWTFSQICALLDRRARTGKAPASRRLKSWT
jgi:hypothetical protein